MQLVMVNTVGSHKTGSLPYEVTVEQIKAVLGEPNVKDDPDKVRYSWGFMIDDELCGIWDYKGRRWSTFGPTEKIKQLLGV